MKNLYIDFDGVILDTITCLYKDPSYIGKDRPYEEQNAYFSNYPWEKIIKDENILCDSINAIKEIIDGSISPLRVPIIIPGSGVNPIEVSTHFPSRTADKLPPLPK